MQFLKTIFYGPGNLVADALGTTDEHERGLLRMLVNSILWITAFALIFMLAVAIR